MSDVNTQNTLAARVRTLRKRCGLSQTGLAEQAGVSASLISKIEQGIIPETTMATAHKLARALRTNTSELFASSLREAESETLIDHVWKPVEQALNGTLPPVNEDPSLDDIQRRLRALKPLLAENRYREVALELPGLIRDVEALDDVRTPRSRLLNVAGWMFVQTHQYALAEMTLKQAVDAAEDRLDAAAAVVTLGWMQLRHGRLTEARELSVKWADAIEPRFSRATTAELALWGRLLIRISGAAVRDNRPGEAEDAIQLARAAAVRIGREIQADSSTHNTFGPATVQMIVAENASIGDKYDKVLTVAERIPKKLLHVNGSGRNRHRLDIANALLATKRPTEATAVMHDIYRTSPEWLLKQRYARRIMDGIVYRRRSLTPEMRALSEALTITG